jgi:hypothetical protein
MDPAITGRQWDFKIVGADLYLLSETPDLVWHVWKNGTEILRVTGAPTHARTFAVVGNHIYFGLGSEENDPYHSNGSTINANSGRVLKAANVL